MHLKVRVVAIQVAELVRQIFCTALRLLKYADVGRRVGNVLMAVFLYKTFLFQRRQKAKTPSTRRVCR